MSGSLWAAPEVRSSRIVPIVCIENEGKGICRLKRKITSFKTRHQKYQDLFTTQDEFTYCLDVHKLVERMGLLKCVLLHKGNKYGSIPIGYTGEPQGESYRHSKSDFTSPI
uniref:Uncharacterized protein n=1 Tax=Lutzomyia longipalpis TaxID=7200 RepID=A0A1B0C9S5_LUTLO